jgi:hypothetical protein
LCCILDSGTLKVSWHTCSNAPSRCTLCIHRTASQQF